MTRYQHMFLEWFNDFLTMEEYANYYCISDRETRKAIELGKIAHESQFGSILEYVGYANISAHFCR